MGKTSPVLRPNLRHGSGKGSTVGAVHAGYPSVPLELGGSAQHAARVGCHVVLVLWAAQGVVVARLTGARAVPVWVRVVNAEAAAPRQLFSLGFLFAAEYVKPCRTTLLASLSQDYYCQNWIGPTRCGATEPPAQVGARCPPRAVSQPVLHAFWLPELRPRNCWY